MEEYDYDDINYDDTIEVGNVVYNEEQLSHQQQEALLSQSYIPDVVQKFLLYFQQCLHDGNIYELHACYDNSFNKLTEKFYKNTNWPSPSAISSLINNDETFLIFYTEVYYRHLYSRLQPTIDDRFQSYNNYCTLFNFILNSKNGPSNLELPVFWAWDIIDEFIYQFNSFSIYKSRVYKRNNPNDPELVVLKKNPEIWGSYSVLNVLYSLSNKASTIQQLKAAKSGQDPSLVAGEYGSKSLYKNLGYFSIIGLLRVHTLLGDFSLALKTIQDIQLNKKALLTKVNSCHFTTYYYVGFCYLMLKRYSDAIKAFSHILLFISRTKNINQNANSNKQYDIVNKKSEQMYALLAMSVVLSPTRLDDVIHSQLREKYGEQIQKMTSGDLKVFEELFLFACPKFISPFINAEGSGDAIHHHLKIFLIDAKNIVSTLNLKSYLNLYSTLDISKLSTLLDNKDVEELRSILLCFKLKNRQIKSTNNNASSDELLDGTSTNLSDIDISLENDLIHISESKGSRKFADWFIRNTIKNFSVQEFIDNK